MKRPFIMEMGSYICQKFWGKKKKELQKRGENIKGYYNTNPHQDCPTPETFF